ncbi:Carboxypeptidase regulatory-like domain protein [uncultured archaeon]|nr:Carboxypeptidase regulatory-like domain protein [uncultured archaeon]
MRKRFLAFIAVFWLVQVALAQNATISGHVTDKDTGRPYSGVSVEVFNATDHSVPVAALVTDDKGFFETEVPGMVNYDIFLRVGKSNPSQSVYVQAGQIQTVDFIVSSRAVSASEAEDSGGFIVVVVVALVVLAVILVDQVLSRRKGKAVVGGSAAVLPAKESLEQRKARLTSEKARIEEMISLTKNKYQHRLIDEESFREIIRDHQKKLIEVEAQLKE